MLAVENICKAIRGKVILTALSYNYAMRLRWYMKFIIIIAD